MILVTFATGPRSYFKYLIESCERYETTIHILGWNEKWIGFQQRTEKMISFLEKKSPDEIVCFIDSYDVILLGSTHDIEKRYKEMVKKYKKPIIVGNCKFEKYINKVICDIIFGKCQNESLNTGTYIGKARDLLHMLKWMIRKDPDPKADDQKIMMKYCQQHEELIYIDVKSELFLTITDYPIFTLKPNEIEIKDKTLYYKGHRPFVLHGPGSADMTSILNKLGYKIPKDEKKDIDTKNKLYVVKRAYSVVLRVIIYIVILLCIILLVFLWKKYKLLA